MDDRRFDALTRWVDTSQTRRGALRTLAGSAFGGALGLSALRGLDAAPKPADAKCSQDTQCASGTCIKYGKCRKNGRLTGKCRCACDNDTECGTGRHCRHRACFSTCSPAGTCDVDFEECGTGNCGCYTSTAAEPEQNCTFTGKNTCLTADCDDETDCPEGYVCSVLQVSDLAGCCNGKVRTCDAPCQAKSVTISASEATAASRDGQGGRRNGHASARN